MTKNHSKSFYFKKDDAVSQVISVILVISIVVSSVGVILGWGVPYIDEKSRESQKQVLLSNFELVDNTVGNLIISGSGSSGTGVITSNNDKANINIKPKNTRLIVTYSYDKNYDFNISGLDDNDQDFSVWLEGSYSGPSNWYSGVDFTYRRKITINHQKVSKNFSDFPILIRKRVDLFQDDAGDLLFTNASGKHKLYHEVENYNLSNNRLTAWVKLDNISSTKDTVLYMYYGNSNCANQFDTNGNVWNNNYKMIHHLSETSGLHYDSTNYNNDGTPEGGLLQDKNGCFNGGDTFDGKDDCISISNSGSLNPENITVSAWVSTENSSCVIVDKIVTLQGYTLDIDDGYARFAVNSSGIGYEATSINKVNDNIFHYLVGTFNKSSGEVKLYVDGKCKGTTAPASMSHNIQPLKIGADRDSCKYLGGKIDEIRISGVSYSAYWINTIYNSSSNNFYNIGLKERKDGKPAIDEIKAYKLDPSMQTDSGQQEIYKMIYREKWYSQSFKAIGDELDKVSLYIGKRGDIRDPLNVSIYSDDNGAPDSIVGSPKEISSDEVGFNADWVECSFGGLSLTEDDYYHIVVDTHRYNSSLAKCYFWRFDKYTTYQDKNGSYSDDEGSNWAKFSNEGDFYRRTFYNSVPTPKTPEMISLFSMDPTGYTGVKYPITIKVNSSDTGTTDNYFFRIDWGDGTNSGWVGPYSEPSVYSTNHIWNKPKSYTIKGQIKNQQGIENEKDNTSLSDLMMYEGIRSPEDIAVSDQAVEEISNGVYRTDFNLKGTILIDLYNDAYPPDMGFYTGNVPFGRIWIFEIGGVVFNSPHSSGNLKMSLENGAVLAIGGEEKNLINEPAFYETDDAIAFRVIQTNGTVGGGGSGKFRLNLKMHNSFNREKPNWLADNVSKFKLHFYGENKDIWLDYFINNYNFSEKNGNMIYYMENEKYFVLDHSFLTFNIRGIN